jgi:ubiquinone/menaquinone biosynthesis C-methylase UbiE
MPSIEWNQREWGAAYSWPGQGSEWSAPWGDVGTHWFATILPRIRNFLPCGTLLEIAPGHGRWTGYLLSSCDRYIGVDLAEGCVQACKKRFGSAENATFVANDGRSLPMIANGSIDFVFSFDSLVHSEADVIDAYIAELARVLAPDGIGFIHHSNLGAHLPALVLARLLEKAVDRLRPILHALKPSRIDRWDHARAKSMTAKRFADACGDAGLACVGQEIIEWGQARKMIDCFSLVARPNSYWDRPNIVVNNTDFMGEAFSARRVASLYSSLGTSTGLASTAARPMGGGYSR